MAFDIASFFVIRNVNTLYYVNLVQVTAFACCDFIAQSILIYRCWIIWLRNIYVVIIPSILAFTFLVIWIASGTAPLFIVQGQLSTTAWGDTLAVTGLATSMVVNALVTGLIVFRIFKVFGQELTTPDNQVLGATSRRTLWAVSFMLIESGMALFLIQLIRLMVTVMKTEAAYSAFQLIETIHHMLNGMTPTIIVVRVSIGLYFHDKDPMAEITGSLRFSPDHPKTVLETGSIGTAAFVDQGQDNQ